MLYGHKDKEAFFKKLVKKDMLSHAYLFFGEPKVGKFYFSKCLAHFLEHRKFDITENSLTDTIFIEKLDDKKSIGIDEFRALKNFVYEKPFISNKRLVIINDAEKITPQAQASALKMVEEAPEHVVFIFITNDERSLLSPLISRLQKIYFKKLSKDKIISILENDFNLSKKESLKLSKLSFGSIGRALDFLNKDKKNEEQTLEEYLDDKISKLFLGDKIKNSSIIKWLLNREIKVKRLPFNLNLEKKVIQYKLSKNEKDSY
jgi:DNA polymerase-3 subunit delta'